jgi:hypothetical protein
MPARHRNFLSEMRNRIENRLEGTTRNRRRPRTHDQSPLNPARQQRNYYARQNTSRKRKRSLSKNSNPHMNEYNPFS